MARFGLFWAVFCLGVLGVGVRSLRGALGLWRARFGVWVSCRIFIVRKSRENICFVVVFLWSVFDCFASMIFWWCPRDKTPLPYDRSGSAHAVGGRSVSVLWSVGGRSRWFLLADDRQIFMFGFSRKADIKRKFGAVSCHAVNTGCFYISDRVSPHRQPESTSSQSTTTSTHPIPQPPLSRPSSHRRIFPNPPLSKTDNSATSGSNHQPRHPNSPKTNHLSGAARTGNHRK